VAAGGGVNMGALTSSEASSVEARYSPVTSMRTRDALRRGELTPRREAGACHAETYRDAADSSIGSESTNSLIESLEGGRNDACRRLGGVSTIDLQPQFSGPSSGTAHGSSAFDVDGPHARLMRPARYKKSRSETGDRRCSVSCSASIAICHRSRMRW
jgi:hypothetical protein